MVYAVERCSYSWTVSNCWITIDQAYGTSAQRITTTITLQQHNYFTTTIILQQPSRMLKYLQFVNFLEFRRTIWPMTRLALCLSSLAYPLYWLPNQLAFCALLLTNQSLECQHQFYPTMDRWLIVSTLHGVICEYVQIFHFIFFKTIHAHRFKST